MTYHVSKSGLDSNAGSLESPFLTISAAASAAQAGDTVIVHEGEYREWVKPQAGGLSNTRRITYQAAEGEKVIIKGSECIREWERVEGSVWKTVLANDIFNGYNPYIEMVTGDWLVTPIDTVHLGDVYLNGMSFYEAENYETLKNPVVRTEVLDNWTKEIVPIKDTEQTKYVWYASVDTETTTILANFHESDPNKELVEVNVRKCCFYPEKAGLNYITVRGFEMAHAATPWAPPTAAEQSGLIGPNWSKGWIIEDCVIHDSKCSGISIGKMPVAVGNLRTSRKDKPGYQYQLESVFAAGKMGWSKEYVGSHIIRNNVIYNCGQNAVVGCFGCVFSEIYNNHIYNIALKREFYGHEIAGIKLHTPIDVSIRHNHIHDCSLGVWLDWQVQGARVSKNLFHSNNRDLFIEVTHGPHIVDHNILGSKYALDNHAQGGAYVRNLFAGKIVLKKMLDRATPYHAPHSTDVAGYAVTYCGDDRFYQNIFIGGKTDDIVGTAVYDGYTISLEAYIQAVDAHGWGDVNIFDLVEQPVYIAENAYFNGATAFENETKKIEETDFDTAFAVHQTGGAVFLSITLPECFEGYKSKPHSTASLARVRIVDADFENPDGTPLTLDSDYFNVSIGDGAVCGPLTCLKSGENRIEIQ